MVFTDVGYDLLRPNLAPLSTSRSTPDAEPRELGPENGVHATGGSDVTACPGKDDSVVTACPGKDDSDVTATRGKDDSVVTATPGKDGSVVTATPGKDDSDVTATPGKDDSVAYSGPSNDSVTAREQQQKALLKTTKSGVNIPPGMWTMFLLMC